MFHELVRQVRAACASRLRFKFDPPVYKIRRPDRDLPPAALLGAAFRLDQPSGHKFASLVPGGASSPTPRRAPAARVSGPLRPLCEEGAYRPAGKPTFLTPASRALPTSIVGVLSPPARTRKCPDSVRAGQPQRRNAVSICGMRFRW